MELQRASGELRDLFNLRVRLPKRANKHIQVLGGRNYPAKSAGRPFDGGHHAREHQQPLN